MNSEKEIYLYHRKPPNMDGDTLYPLNILKDNNPDIYSEYVKKYENREWLLERAIPKLNCLWNDVIHLTAVSPSELKRAFLEADFEIPNSGWYKIPLSLLSPENIIVYLYQTNIPNRKESLEEEFVELDLDKIDSYGKIGEDTIDFYKDQISKGVRPLMFHMVPHILYRGEINTKNLEIVYPN